jgi:hypothetical protein
MMKWAAIVLLASAPASADPLVRAITRHEEGDVTALRTRLPDDSARCALGVVYIFRDDLTRAALHLEGCAAMRIAPSVKGWVRLAVPALSERLRLSELAELTVTTEPPGLAVTIDTVPGEVFTAAAPIWLPAGTHELRAGDVPVPVTVTVTVRARTRAVARLALPPEALRPQIDPRVTVMRANDCALLRKGSGSRTCKLGRDDDDPSYYWDDPDYVPPRYPTWPGSRHHDPIAMILQTAEEL